MHRYHATVLQLLKPISLPTFTFNKILVRLVNLGHVRPSPVVKRFTSLKHFKNVNKSEQLKLVMHYVKKTFYFKEKKSGFLALFFKV